ncbi:unnamed protein product [Microthlaspi erraticum]|uniref:CCHC-type domain-containing protein n=1 Tax=Microthlaspi erraticum TaxID=1685480 RepID=A0A6D2JEV1_9BRAS|nr:unnamed protein product [Microthlaspi erraticum]
MHALGRMKDEHQKVEMPAITVFMSTRRPANDSDFELQEGESKISDRQRTLRHTRGEFDEATMSRFLGGLNREIQDIVEMQNCVAIEAAPTNLHRDSKPFAPKSETKPLATNQDRSRTERTPPARTRDLKCFRCQGFGHYASDCLNKKVMIIRDNGEIESEEDPEPEKEEEPEEYEAVPVQGKLLVARRVLSTQVRTIKMSSARTSFTRDA